MTLVTAGRPMATVSTSSLVTRPAPLASGFDADADRAGHAGAADAAVAGRVLGQVLLVIVLGVVELAGRDDLGGDRAIALGGEGLLVGRPGGLRRRGLGGVRRIDARAVLGADIVALAHALGR